MASQSREDSPPADQIHDSNIVTDVFYMVKDPLHEKEKPYTLNYYPGEGLPRTNVTNKIETITIRDGRKPQTVMDFQGCGFTAMHLKSQLTTSEFCQHSKVAAIYYPECKKLLEGLFPDAARIEIVEHLTRKRHDTFPIATGTDYEHTQPTTLVHIDYTNESAEKIAREALNIRAEMYHRLVTVNLWKSIYGTVHDWPLALCDSRTVDHSLDTIAADIVSRKSFTDNSRVYYRVEHEWYYYDGLREDEIILFRQSDSDIEGGGGVPHTGFPNPNAPDNVQPRESIEARAFIFFA